MSTVYFWSALIIAAVSLSLILTHEYEDGVLGRVALIVLCISNGLIVSDCLQGGEWRPSPNSIATELAMALFLSRHLYRFWRWRLCGHYSWRPARK